MLFGEAPPEFLLEVLFRVLVVYTALLFFVRLLGKRMAGELTITEMSVMIMLGGIVSAPIQSPDRGILQGLVTLAGITLLQQGTSWLTVKNERAEKAVIGDMKMLVKDGIIQLEQLKTARISRQQVLAELRRQEIFNLKKVKRMYLEACGLFSIYKDEKDEPGLATFPPGDKKLLEGQEVSDTYTACSSCGNTIKKGASMTSIKCPVCGDANWKEAIK